MDCYRDMSDVEDAFVQFCERVPFYGLNLLCIDDARLRTLIPRISRRVATYGTSTDAEFRLATIERGQNGALQRFAIEYKKSRFGEFELVVPGRHNALNATAAVAVGAEFDIPPAAIAQGLREFRGVDRRFQRKGIVGGVTVVDDYGHHPTEIRATLAAARDCGFNRIHVIFQPHRYSRTRDLMDDFSTAFADADSLQVLDIYAASEEPIPGITGDVLASRILEAHGGDVEYAAGFEAAVHRAAALSQTGDLILTLGAGNVVQVGPMVLDRLQRNLSATSPADVTQPA
jgi:UDP-N-acetylmuramate--alanine ligase